MKTINKNKKTRITFVLVGLATAVMLISTGNARADTWTQKADMPTARMRSGTGVVNGKIYVISTVRQPGLQTVEEYDPATDTWAAKADMPTQRALVTTAVVDGKIYVIGGETWLGQSARATVEEYDPATDTWTQKADMPTPRTRSAAGVVDGKIYVIGGARGGGASYPEMSTVEAYDPATDTWTRKADMPTARELLSTSAVGGKIYAIGGQREDSVFRGVFSTVEMYDPATDTWTKKADAPLPRKVHSASVLKNTIYVFGGRTVIGGLPQSTLFLYDPAADTWVAWEDMPYAVANAPASTVDGRIYLIGGSSAPYPYTEVLSTVWEYEPGFPPPDFNGDGTVDIKDLLRLIESWGQDDPIVDIAPPSFGDGIVDAMDLELLMSYWEQPIDDTTLIAHWALDEAEGDIAQDSVGGRNGFSDGYVLGNPFWLPTGGHVDGAIQLDGVDDLIITSPVLNPSDGPFSILAWIKGGAAAQVIMSEPSGSNWLSVDPLEGYLMTELASAGRSSAPLLSETVITDKSWHRIGLVWDGLNRTLYVDGVVAAQDTQDGLQSLGTGMYFGAGSIMAPGTFFSGLIDDVRIYNRAVSP